MGRQQKEKAGKAAIQLWRGKREKERRVRKEERKARKFGGGGSTRKRGATREMNEEGTEEDCNETVQTEFGEERGQMICSLSDGK